MPNTTVAPQPAVKPQIKKHLDQMKIYFQEVDDFSLEVEDNIPAKIFKAPFPITKPTLPAIVQAPVIPIRTQKTESVAADDESDEVALIPNSPKLKLATPPKKKINVNLVSRR
jgi:hypothetical protein